MPGMHLLSYYAPCLLHLCWLSVAPHLSRVFQNIPMPMQNTNVRQGRPFPAAHLHARVLHARRHRCIVPRNKARVAPRRHDAHRLPAPLRAAAPAPAPWPLPRRATARAPAPAASPAQARSYAARPAPAAPPWGARARRACARCARPRCAPARCARPRCARPRALMPRGPSCAARQAQHVTQHAARRVTELNGRAVGSSGAAPRCAAAGRWRRVRHLRAQVRGGVRGACDELYN